MRSLIFRPSGIHTPWNKLIMIMLKYQKQNLPSWIPIFSLTQGSWLAFFSTTASALAIEADAVLRDPRCLNERCPVLGQGSWTCCLNQLKDLRDSSVSLLEIKELLLNKLIPNITVLKMPFAFPQMNLCLASHSSKLENFFFASTTTTTWSTEVQPQKQDWHWVVWPVVHPHGHTQAWQEPAIYDVLPAAFLSSKTMEGAPDKNQRTLNFSRLVPKKLKVLPIQFTHNFGMYLEHTSILYKKTSS